MHIRDLKINNVGHINQTAKILFDSFKKHHPDAWPDLQSALKEVNESLQPGRIIRIAIDNQGKVIGWPGALSHYDGNVWELHPPHG